MGAFATIDDIEVLVRVLQNDERDKAEKLLDVVSDLLRQTAKRSGKDLEEMVENGTLYTSVLKSVVCDIVGRALNDNTDSEAMTSRTETALGISVSGTYLNPGGGLYIKKSELERLGLRGQKIGMASPWD